MRDCYLAFFSCKQRILPPSPGSPLPRPGAAPCAVPPPTLIASARPRGAAAGALAPDSLRVSPGSTLPWGSRLATGLPSCRQLWKRAVAAAWPLCSREAAGVGGEQKVAVEGVESRAELWGPPAESIQIPVTTLLHCSLALLCFFSPLFASFFFSFNVWREAEVEIRQDLCLTRSNPSFPNHSSLKSLVQKSCKIWVESSNAIRILPQEANPIRFPLLFRLCDDS